MCGAARPGILARCVDDANFLLLPVCRRHHRVTFFACWANPYNYPLVENLENFIQTFTPVNRMTLDPALAEGPRCQFILHRLCGKGVQLERIVSNSLRSGIDPSNAWMRVSFVPLIHPCSRLEELAHSVFHILAKDWLKECTEANHILPY